MSTTHSDADTLAKGSPNRFGYSWDRYADLLPAHEEQFLRWTAQPKTFWSGKWFVDGGCGIGRNAYWPMTYGAAGGVALDVDDRTLQRARRNLEPFASVEVRKQSIYEIAEEGVFDVAFSIGVVHHLADPEAAVRRLARAVKPGGGVMVWLYGRENNGWIVRLFNPMRHALFSKAPLWLVHALSWPLSALLWCALRLGFPPGAYYRLIRGFSFDHLRAIVFDHMIPHIALYYTRQEAEALLVQAGLTDVRATWVNENSWLVIGTKPETWATNEPGGKTLAPANTTSFVVGGAAAPTKKTAKVQVASVMTPMFNDAAGRLPAAGAVRDADAAGDYRRPQPFLQMTPSRGST